MLDTSVSGAQVPIEAALRRCLQLSAKPCGRSEGLHRIDFNHSLMDMIARRALERPDVKARGAGGDARQHGSCLACRAWWLVDNHS
jgi:hypothetical protein